MGGERAPFIVTVDAEGDDAWSRPARTETRNAAFLPRFQRLCERHGLRASWLAEHAMALDPAFREFGRDLLARGAGEIGMHLHAWETPPFTPLTDDDRRRQPYLTEYPDDVMRAKIERHTHTHTPPSNGSQVSLFSWRYSGDSCCRERWRLYTAISSALS